MLEMARWPARLGEGADRPCRRMRGWAAALAVVWAVSAAGPCAAEEDKRSKVFSAAVGPQIYEHDYATGSKPASTQTIKDVLQLSEQLGYSYNVSDRWQAQVAVQTTEAVTRPGPEQPSRWTDLSIQPGVGYLLGKVFDVDLSPVLSVRTQGRSRLAFGLQPQLGAKAELGAGLSLRAQIQVPVYLAPERSVQITPLVALGYQL